VSEPTTAAIPQPATDLPEPRSLLRRALLVALVSRLGIFAVAALTTYLVKMPPASWALRLPRLAEPFKGAPGHLLNSWAHWDGVWYIKIASNGYAASDGSVAFFPLYPLLVRWLGVLFRNNLVISGMLVSLVCFFVAVWLLYRLVARDFGDRVAYRTVWFISIFPTAFYWQAVYSESLFLMLSVACIMWAREERWKLAGLAGLLAVLTRSAGFLLLVPMTVCYFEQRDWKLRRIDAQSATLLMVVEGLMVWMAYLSLGFGRPLLFAQVQDQWRRSLNIPTTAIWRGLQSAVQGGRQIISRQTRHLYWPSPDANSVMPLAYANLMNLTALAIAGLAIWYGLRRLPVAYSAFAIAAVGYPLLFPARFQPLLSMPRFVLAAFPLFISIALYTDERPRTRVVVSVVFLIGLVLLTGKFAVFSWVA
jgi:hypothetical protein